MSEVGLGCDCVLFVQDLLRAKRIAEMEEAKQSAAAEQRQIAEEAARQPTALERFTMKHKRKAKT